MNDGEKRENETKHAKARLMRAITVILATLYVAGIFGVAFFFLLLVSQGPSTEMPGLLIQLAFLGGVCFFLYKTVRYIFFKPGDKK